MILCNPHFEGERGQGSVKANATIVQQLQYQRDGACHVHDHPELARADRVLAIAMAAPLLPFFQVDVFASDAYRGNPVAVVVALDEDVAAALSTDDMAAFARWTNLSETTFVLPSSAAADYRLRIFTPGTELPFAGHPTLGSCRAWLAHGGRPQTPGVVVQECGAGLVQIRVDAGVHAKTGEGAASSSSSEADREALYRDESATLAFSAPPLLRTGRPDAGDLARVCAAVGLDAQRDVVDAQWIVNGPQWLAVQLRDAQAVLDVNLVDGGIPAGGLVWGVFGAYEPGIGPDGADWEVRTFAPSDGIPVSGQCRGWEATGSAADEWANTLACACFTTTGRPSHGKLYVRCLCRTRGELWPLAAC